MLDEDASKKREKCPKCSVTATEQGMGMHMRAKHVSLFYLLLANALGLKKRNKFFNT